MDYLRRSMREYTGAFCIALSMAILIASPLMVTNSEDTELSEESKSCLLYTSDAADE